MDQMMILWPLYGFGYAIGVHLLRLFILMSSGQRFGNCVNETRRVLDRYEILRKSDLPITKQYSTKLSQLQKRLDIYRSLHPISPYKIIDLNLKTFWATLAAIIGHILTLTKLSEYKDTGLNNSTISFTKICNFTDM